MNILNYFRALRYKRLCRKLHEAKTAYKRFPDDRRLKKYLDISAKITRIDASIGKRTTPGGNYTANILHQTLTFNHMINKLKKPNENNSK